MPPTLSAPRLSLLTEEPTRTLGLVEPRWTTRKGLLRIRSVNDGGHWCLELDGELDRSNSDVLEKELRLREGPRAVHRVFRLTGTEHRLSFVS